MMFLYAALNLFLDAHWTLGSIFFRYFEPWFLKLEASTMNSLSSLAVSIKMNILLFAPALLLAYIATQGIAGTIKQLSICAGIQVEFLFN